MSGPSSPARTVGGPWPKASEIYHTVMHLLTMARDEGIPTYVAADRLAERRIAEARAARKGTSLR